jgi:mannose-6-phosphate isomerase
MSRKEFNDPLVFEPIFMERMWGGRRLESEFHKKLPPDVRIGESWEIVDRPEAQSVVAKGPLRGMTLHELWTDYREEVFGNAPKTGSLTRPLPRFPLLIKILDAREKLSLQVHPPEHVASRLGGEPKTEFWYVAAADPGAELCFGFRAPIANDRLEETLRNGTVINHVHKITVHQGDAVFLPAGRLHAVGAGNLLIEVQQNSDTTYRVFDWNRVGDKGKPRQLHIEQAFQSIDFNDIAPNLVEPQDELLVRNESFEIQKWNLDHPRAATTPGQFAIVCCLNGLVRYGDTDLLPGEFCLIPARLPDRRLEPKRKETSMLRITIPT